MHKFFSKIKARRSNFARDQKGTSSIEFILIFPLFFMMFALSIESGFLTTQKIFLERAVDMTIRKLSLDTEWDTMTADLIAEKICEEGVLSDCTNRLTIEAYVVDPSTGSFTLGPVKCIDISEDPEVQPANSYSGDGGYDEYLFIRVCLLVEPLFTATPLTPTLQLNSSGGYYLSAMGMLTIEGDPNEIIGVGPGS